MSFNRPTLPELYDRVSEDIHSALGIQKRSRYSVASTLAKTIAGMSHMLHGHIDALSKNLLPDSAEVETLERWAAIWGVTRKAPSFAEGTIIFSGEAHSKIPKGTLLQNDAGVTYQTLFDMTVGPDRTVTIPIKATTAGLNGNVAAGGFLSLVNPLAGISSLAQVSAEGIGGGANTEDDKSLRKRLLDRIRNAPQGGAAHDYVNWALEISGVTRAWVYPLYWGVGSVGVSFVLDDEDPIIPNPESAKFKELQAHISSKAPVTARIVVFAPTAKPLNPVIKMGPSAPSVKESIISEIRDLLLRETAPGGALGADGILYLSRLREAISMAEGEFDHKLVFPTEDVTASKGEIITLGEVSWIS